MGEPAEAAPPAARGVRRGGAAGVMGNGGGDRLVDVRAVLHDGAAQLVGQEVPHGARPLPVDAEAPRWHHGCWPILLVPRVKRRHPRNGFFVVWPLTSLRDSETAL